MALTAGNIALVRINATRQIALFRLFSSGYRVYWLIALMACGVVAICIAQPELRALFGFTIPTYRDIAIALIVGLGSVLLFDLIKVFEWVQTIMGWVPDSLQIKP